MKESTLANAELAIMDLLWDEGILTSRSIREKLYTSNSKSQHGTVQKLLQRLEKKLYISVDRSQFTHRFIPLISRQKYAGMQLETLATKLTQGSFAPLITHLVEESKISNDEIVQLRAILDKHQEGEASND